LQDPGSFPHQTKDITFYLTNSICIFLLFVFQFWFFSKEVLNFAIMCYVSVLFTFKRIVLEQYDSRMGKRVILRQNYIFSSLPLTKTW